MEYGLPAFSFWCSANLGFLGAFASPVPPTGYAYEVNADYIYTNLSRMLDFPDLGLAYVQDTARHGHVCRRGDM